MNLPRPCRTLWSIAVLAIPTLAAASQPSLGATPATAPAAARVIVKFKADSALTRESVLLARDAARAPVQHAARLAQRTGLALRDGYAIAPRTQVVFANGISSAQLVQRLQLDPDVEYAEVDQRVKIAAAPNDPLYPAGQAAPFPAVGQWYLRAPDGSAVSAIDAEGAWGITTGSAAVVVAVLDTGVRFDHPDLASKLLPGYDFVSVDGDGSFATANDGNGRDADASDPGDWVTTAERNNTSGPLGGCDVVPSSWHGTQTAALIGAATNNAVGMASIGRDVRILPVRVLGKCGGFVSDVIAGMYWAAGLPVPPATSTGLSLGSAPNNPTPAKLLNMSLGSASTSCPRSYQDAFDALTAAGATVVVSAGNDAGLAVGQPANCTGAIGVGGLRHIGTKVGFSDVGPQIAISAPGGNCVNLTGACLYPIVTATNTGTTGPTVPSPNAYSDANEPSVGTSFSAPLVAGTAALMLSVNGNLTPAQVRLGLTRTARAFVTSGAGATTPACRAPDSNEQDECYCTTTTCGAGMLSASGAVGAAASTKAWIVPSASQVDVNGTVQLDGSGSWAAPPGSIGTYRWEIRDGQALATLQTPNAPMASLRAAAPGTVTVRLTVTEAGGAATAFDETTVTIGASPSSGGGGALSWPWLALLALAVLALGRPPRRVPPAIRTSASRRA